MANELVTRWDTPSLATIYAAMEQGANAVDASTGALLAVIADNVPSFAIPASDEMLETRYLGSVPPNTPTGYYQVNFFIQAGDTPVWGAGGDRRISSGNYQFTAPLALDSVRIVNKLSQSLTVTINGEGGVQVITLASHGISAPVSASALTSYTLGLQQSGHVTLIAP